MCSVVDCIFLWRALFKRRATVNPLKIGDSASGNALARYTTGPPTFRVRNIVEKRPCQAMTYCYLHARHSMPIDSSPATKSTDGRRTAIALVSATLISVAVLALLAIFDVK